MLIRPDEVKDGAPVVTVGSRVRVRDAYGEDTFLIVDPEDSDPARRAISRDCPMGRALLGHAAGARVRVLAPVGHLYLTVLNVEAAGGP